MNVITHHTWKLSTESALAVRVAIEISQSHIAQFHVRKTVRSIGSADCNTPMLPDEIWYRVWVWKLVGSAGSYIAVARMKDHPCSNRLQFAMGYQRR